MEMIIIGILLLLSLVLLIIIWAKNNNTLDNRIIITRAIYRYHIALFDKGILEESLVNYDDMRSYEATLFRIWDWGYKNILPKDKFEIIKPYIKEEQK